MTITAGTRLGPYEVVAPIGAGGMGEVWRARDTRLDREVAIKILPTGFAQNEQLRARFEREAKTISSLNHPNICTLFDVGHEGETHFLVMELIEGESLADRLMKGSLPLDQVLRYGAQIADALDRAHRQGITHRDLKPGNVMISKSGAKLLDFGLARTAAEAPLQGMTEMPTQAKPLTAEGTILGTFQYMAPEQLEGLEADARTDIFSLGALLYEMATGQRAFKGSNRTSLIAAIVSSHPEPISTITKVAPAALDHIVRKCIEKDPDDRWQSAHDVASELRWISEAGSQADVAIPRSKRSRRRMGIAVAGVVAGTILGATGHWWLAKRSVESPRPLHYVIEYGDMRDSRPALAPDGHSIAYRRDGAIHVRDLSRLDSVLVPGTEGGHVPFWSPDGTWIGFSADDKLWKIRLDGSGKSLLCSQAPGTIAGGAVWRSDGKIVFDTGITGLLEVSEMGGDPREILAPGENEADFHSLGALPGDKGYLFVVHEGDTFDNITMWDGQERRTLLRIPGQQISQPVYASSGHIVFDRGPQGRGIWAVPFSLDRLETVGDPFPVAPVGTYPATAGSTLVYTPVVPVIESEIVEVDRSGQVVRTIGEPKEGLYPTPALSPDGRQLAIPVNELVGADLWLYDVEGGEATRLTFHESPGVGAPSWTPDGQEVFYYQSSSSEDISLRAVKVDGSGARDIGRGWGAVAFTPDGKTMIYNLHSKGFNWNLWRKELGADGEGEALLTDVEWELHPELSPDGRFLAYDKRGVVLIRTFPDMGGPWQVATGDAMTPHWSRDGKSIFYLSDYDLMEAAVTTTATGVRVGTPRKLFTFVQAPVFNADWPGFALGPSGETFIMVRPVERPPGIVVVQNWLSLVEANR